jgi:aminoethylphosphonate catabolism LysR family transcriptional regulator
VATTGGFTSAAKALHLTQPAVTHQVKALEEAYRVELFHRSGRRVILTDLGAALLEITRSFFELERQADELLSGAAGLRGGYLHVGADGPFHLMRPLGAFATAHPEVRVSVTMGNSRLLQQKLLTFEADVAVLATLSEHEDLLAVELGRHRVVLVLPPGHPWRTRRSVHIMELEGLTMVAREQGSSTRRAIRAALAEAGAEPRFALELGSREAVREAVAAGLGAAAISEPELGHDGRLTAVAIDGADVVTHEYVVCRRDRSRVPAIAAFLELARTMAMASSD